MLQTNCSFLENELLDAARKNNFRGVSVCENFEFAVRVAALKSKGGQAVLLSPASASFDEFASYEERGEAFVQIVRALEKAEQIQEQLEENEAPDTDKANDGIDGIECENDTEPEKDGEIE